MAQLITSPQYLDTNQERLGLHGLPPELEAEETNISRRQQIANALVARGLQPVQPYSQAGQFVVPMHWAQGLGQLGQAMIGGYLSGEAERDRTALGNRYADIRAQEVERHLKETSPTRREVVDLPGAATTAPPPPLQNLMSRFDAAQELPLTTRLARLLTGDPTIGAEEIERIKAAQQPPAPVKLPQVLLREVPQSPEDIKRSIVKGLMSQNPQVASMAQLQYQDRARKEERETQHEFLSREKALDRAARLESDKAHIDQLLQMKLISEQTAGEMKAALQQSHDRMTLQMKEMELAGRKDIAAIQAQQGKVPPGYRATKEGNLEAIPGGPADQKQQGAFNQDTAILQSSMSDLDRLASTANMLKNHPGLKGITGVAGAFPNLPGGQAADAHAQLNTLKSQIAFSVLQTMRNNSKTGGALGNVSDAEGKRLEANLAALDKAQSYEQMVQGLQQIIEFTQGSKERLHNAFNLKHKGTPPAQSAQPTPGGGALSPAEQDELQQLRKKYGR